MITRVCVLTLFVSLLLSSPSRAQWIQGPDFPNASSGREHAAGLTYQGSVLALGGSPFTQNLDGRVDIWPEGGSAWSAGPILEGTIVGQGAGEDSMGRIILFGGRALIGDDVGKAYVWDLVQGKQGNIASRGASAPEIGFAWATDSAGGVYSIGGGPGATATPSDPNSAYLERYEATMDAWVPLTSLPEALADAAAAANGAGHVFVIGGYPALGGAPTSKAYRYDIASDTWSDLAVADLPVPLAGARAAFGADGRLYVVGGRDSLGTLATTWVWEAASDTWTAGPAMSLPRESFALTLGPDDHLWAMGGAGTGTVERLWTPRCATFPSFPDDRSVWEHQIVQLTAVVSGGDPFSFQWELFGVPLVDGPNGVSTISGATSESLVITNVAPGLGGEYRLKATNACGAILSPAAVLTVRTPPAIGSPWIVDILHPAGANSSGAETVRGDLAAGVANFPDATYGALDHPMTWDLVTGASQDLTPPGSVGGGISSQADSGLYGWYWWPYQTPQGTGYDRHASYWSASSGAHLDIQPSGWEYGSVSDADGTQMVGTLRWDDTSTTADGALWNAPVKSAIILTPSVAWGSSASAVDDGAQFGSVNLGFGVVHAARWEGNAASFVDINPAGSSWSYVLGAGSGLQVGRATFQGVHHAALWSGGAETFQDLHPVGASSSYGADTESGIQVGIVNNHAAAWTGSAGSYVDLQSFLPAEYSSSIAESVTVDSFGTVEVAGRAFDSVASVWRAVVWRKNDRVLSSDVETVNLTAGGRQSLQVFAGPASGGRQMLLLGSASGTSPGVPVNNHVHLPLNVDGYFNFLLTNPNGPFHTGSWQVLDAQGLGRIDIDVPPGLPFTGPITLHHAYVLFENGVVLASNAVPLILD